MIAGVTIDRDRLRRTTALHLLCERARSTPDSVAFRSKHLGIYRERTWSDYARLVAHHAHALKSMSLNMGAQKMVDLTKRIEEQGRSGNLDREADDEDDVHRQPAYALGPKAKGPQPRGLRRWS